VCHTYTPVPDYLLLVLVLAENFSDVQGSAWPESLGLGSALGAQAYRNLRPSLGARLGLGSGSARPGPRLC